MNNVEFKFVVPESCIVRPSGVSTSSGISITEEWKAKCLWTSYGPFYSRPEYLQLRRESVGEAVFISGTFELSSGDKCLLQRKFKHLLYVGCKTAIIEFSDYDGSCYPFSISGTLNIPPAHHEFGSLFSLSKDYQRLWTDAGANLSDVTIRCGGESFYCHKAMLIARSPVFRAMFLRSISGLRCGKVEIEDISPEIFKLLLSYIYSGDTSGLTSDSAEGLLCAADTYKLLELKKRCIDLLKNSVKMDNALKLLVLGHLHDEDLKTCCLSFIYDNLSALEKQEGFNEFTQSYPYLLTDILLFVGKKTTEGIMRNSSK